MGKKSKTKNVHFDVLALCKALLQLCDEFSGRPNDLDYFRGLHSLMRKIREFQNGLSIVRAYLPNDRESALENLQKHYENCFDFDLLLRESEGAGFGLCAAKPIEKGSRLLHVPSKYAVSLHNSSSSLPEFLLKDPLLSSMDNIALSFVVLNELCLAEKSSWKEYIYSLPHTYSTVAYFSDVEFAIVDGFPVAETVLNAYRNICRQYAYFYLLFDRNRHENNLPKYAQTFCLEDYLWAISTVMSRNNALPSPSAGGENTLCLIPLWDMINHKQNRVTTDYDESMKSIVFYAMESYQEGEEVFMDYGKRSSTEFLLYSGFVPEVNASHTVPLKLSLSKFDKLATIRTKILEKLGLGSEIRSIVAADNNESLPPDLLAFARVFVMNEDELKATLDDFSSPVSGIAVSERLFSGALSLDDQVDKEAKKFVEGRLSLLIRGYESRLEKNIKSTSVSGEIAEGCVRLCRQDIATLSKCLNAFS